MECEADEYSGFMYETAGLWTGHSALRSDSHTAQPSAGIVFRF